MTGRVKSGATRIEEEIERNREESNWLKVIELAERLKEKSPECGRFLSAIKKTYYYFNYIF